jgi:hypothetical protein
MKMSLEPRMKFQPSERFLMDFLNRSPRLFTATYVALKAWSLFALKFVIPLLALVLTPVVVIWRFAFSNEELSE